MKTKFHRSIILLLLAFSCGNLFGQNAAPKVRSHYYDEHGGQAWGEARPGDIALCRVASKTPWES